MYHHVVHVSPVPSELLARQASVANSLHSSMADAASLSSSSRPHVVEDCRGLLQVLSDGTVVRPAVAFPSPFPLRDDADVPVDWADVLFSPDHGLRLRLYRPRLRSPPPAKLPVLVYFHGGGFCLGTRTWPGFHNCCLRLAAELPALVVAPDYRLAPEHRLPAALDDAVAVFQWLRSQAAAHPFFADSDADLGRVFVSGESAGGNLAHHMAVRFGSDAGRAELAPVAIQGFVLLMPFFTGKRRTRSEEECPPEAFLNKELSDRMWRLALPLGADSDHPLANPFGPEGGPATEAARTGPMLVVAGERDLLRDRNVEYAERMKGLGNPVTAVVVEGEEHGFFTLNLWSEPVGRVLEDIRRFMERTGSGPE